MGRILSIVGIFAALSLLLTGCGPEKKRKGRYEERLSRLRRVLAGIRPKTDRNVYYTVRKGDTLYSVGKSYAIDVQTLMEANRIASASQLRVGQELFIPDEKDFRRSAGKEKTQSLPRRKLRQCFSVPF